MKKISELLEKFGLMLKSGRLAREAVISAVKKHSGAAVDEINIEIKDGAVKIKASPAAKSEIFLHRAEILAELQSLLGPAAPKELI